MSERRMRAIIIALHEDKQKKQSLRNMVYRRVPATHYSIDLKVGTGQAYWISIKRSGLTDAYTLDNNVYWNVIPEMDPLELILNDRSTFSGPMAVSFSFSCFLKDAFHLPVRPDILSRGIIQLNSGSFGEITIVITHSYSLACIHKRRGAIYVPVSDDRVMSIIHTLQNAIPGRTWSDMRSPELQIGDQDF
jgi:hypothetical protein